MIVTINDDFDLEKIRDSGECFRVKRFEDDTYRFIKKDNVLYIKNAEGNLYEISCSEEDWNGFWYDYFDMGRNYADIRDRLSCEDSYSLAAVEFSRGIRILKQDPWETLFSFIISQNNNIPSIKKSIEALCEAFGSPKMDNSGDPFFCIPSPQALSQAKGYELKKAGVGYRDKYLSAAAKAVAVNKTDLAAIAKMNDQDALAQLKKINGVGDKVGSCVLLFGFHRLNAFPIDTWIKKILEREYNNEYPLDDYSPYNGLYQQYMFAYYRNKASLASELDKETE